MITGAASGLGLETSRQFAAAGHRLVMVDWDEAALHRACERTGEPDRVVSVCGDVSVTDTATRAVAAAEAAFGRLDVLCNNAGIDPPTATTFAATTDDDWDRIMRVNLRSAFLFSRAAVPALRRSGAGAIVNTASLAALRPIRSEAAYSVSKAAVLALTRGLALELADSGVRVNCVCPGALESPVGDRAAGMTPDELRARTERLASGTPMGRVGTYAEVARTMLFLAGPAAAYVTGTALAVDGGRHVAQVEGRC